MNPGSRTDDHARQLIAAALETLDQGEALLAALDDDAYTRRLPVAFNACIGGHYRHCLDHFRSVLEGAQSGAIDYDRRERDTLVERDRFAALNATRRLREAVAGLDPRALGVALPVTCKTSYALASSQTSPASVGRELMYVVAHAVHHYALIGILGGLMGASMPAGFGVAPSTLKHQAGLAKAAST
jgi:hypothetical protein